MREIVYKGQHCWLIGDVKRMIARKDDEIAELEVALKIARVDNKVKGKGSKKEDKKKDDEIRGDAVEDDEGPDELGERPKSDDFNPPNLGTPLTGDGIMGKSSK